jgi:hypothetical protein
MVVLAAPRDNADRFLSEAFNLSAVPGRGAPPPGTSSRSRTASASHRGTRHLPVETPALTPRR